jgi:hypothetical protein
LMVEEWIYYYVSFRSVAFQIGCAVCAVAQHTKTKVINMFLSMEIIGKRLVQIVTQM